MNYGDPRLPERIWNKIITLPYECDCWLWLGETDSWGYGRVWYNKRKRMAHRVVYQALTGKRIYRTLDHTCVNPACVYPGHLQDITQRKNNILSIQRRAHACNA